MSNIHDRLRQARIDAGFQTMSDAARHFDWPTSTYGGHENGTRGIKPPDVAKYAQAFDVTQEWLFSGRAARTISPAPLAKGFSEPAAVPFVGRSDTERRSYLALAEATTPRPRHASLHHVARDVPGLLLLKGDVLIVDLKPTPRDGQVVLIQATDPETGEATIELATMLAGQVVPPFGSTFATNDTAIMGVVLLTVRPTPAR